MGESPATCSILVLSRMKAIISLAVVKGKPQELRRCTYLSISKRYALRKQKNQTEIPKQRRMERG
jgi:hypothetical protein